MKRELEETAFPSIQTKKIGTNFITYAKKMMKD
jgi:hypothetical protein